MIFAINDEGVDYFQDDGRDSAEGFRPIIFIGIFKGHKDSGGVAYWIHSDNSFLGAIGLWICCVVAGVGFRGCHRRDSGTGA